LFSCATADINIRIIGHLCKHRQGGAFSMHW